MAAWYGFTFDNARLAEKQLASMDKKIVKDYLIPTCLCAEMGKKGLRMRETPIFGRYVFIKTDLNHASNYYNLVHNLNFPGNLRRMGRPGTAIPSLSEEEVSSWKSLSQALHQPLRISREGYRITNKALSGVKLLHYFGRKKKALIEYRIGGVVGQISVAAYMVGDHSPAAQKLGAVYRMEAKARRAERKAHVVGNKSIGKSFRSRLRALVERLRPKKLQCVSPRPKAPSTVCRPTAPAVTSRIRATSSPP
ncbi:MAG: hypothetical protein ABF449_13120 [Ethanoligenens sp.]